ncbi:P-loop containing nucleoside triphosphate hydrolase protein [Lactarius quietus]|nr:P-loop containing nucleoside triphosphate hydrolase protein [Lactarius quietus]
MVLCCEVCGCNFSPNSLAQHNKGKKHLRNAAAIVVPTPVTPHQPPLSASNLPNSQPASLPSVTSPAISVPTPTTSDPRVTVSHENGLDFVVEGAEDAGQPSFSPVDHVIIVEKTQVLSILSISEVRLLRPTGTPASCFNVSWSWETSVVRQKKSRRIFVSFQAPHAGTFRVSLHLVFCDNSQPSGEEFVIVRKLRGSASLPVSHVGSAHPQVSSPGRDRVNDHAAPFPEEEDVLPDSDGTGISVSDEDGVDFGIVKRNGLNGPFHPSSSSVTISHARGFPAVNFVEARIRSWEGSESSFRATFEGRSAIRAGANRTVQLEFIPEFEGRFEATLQLIFLSQQLGRFAVSRRLLAIAGSLDDHHRSESLNQDGYVPRSGSGQQIPPEKIIPLLNSGWLGGIPEYKLPELVQEAVDTATFKRPYNKKAPGLIASLKPRNLAMDTYAEFFTALLNVEEGHQQRDILDQRPIEVEIETRGTKHFIEFENHDEDLLPEVIVGDFLWLEDRQEDVYYDTRIADANIFMRGSLAVLKILLEVPTSFDPYRGAQFLLRFRLNRVTLRRQYHALALLPAHLRRLLFPSPSDIKSIPRLSQAEIDDLPLVNENIREDEQQLHAVVSILQQPRGSVPFIIYGPPGTGKTSTVVESIMQLVNNNDSSKILACTPSNAAADLLIQRLATAGLTVDQLLRLNARSREIKSIPEDVRPFSGSPKPSQLRTYRVVLCTCSSAALLQTLRIRAGHFSHIIIDEAAQADEPLSLIPISFFANENTNVILAGDPNQLGPVIKSSPASEAGLGKSFLQRLMPISNVYGLATHAGKTIVDLQRNRRLHGAIIAWPNRYLYEDIMRAHAIPVVARLFLQSEVLVKKGFPIVFHGIKGRELRGQHSPSYLNIHEASVVRDYCLRLIGDHENKIYPDEIGVIAPYKAQVRAIRELLRPVGLKEVSVGSVEQFQGQERKVIIFATTRSNSEVDKRKAMGFVQNRQRMNVAITRAQSLLIVVGDPEVLGKDELWRTFLNYACVRGGWTGKMLTWKPKEDVHVPGYEVVPRAGGVVHGESYIDGKSENIYRFTPRVEAEAEGRTTF